MKDEVRVLVVADDPLTRAGLAALLAAEPTITVVGQAPSSIDIAASADIYRPDVLLWDPGWNPGPALERLAALVDILPPVLALLSEAGYAAEAWSAGARGLLARDIDGARMAAALVAAARGFVVIEPQWAAALIGNRETPQDREWLQNEIFPPLPDELTPRELEVLRLVAEGLANKEIAVRLGISDHTVKFHVNAILSKLGVQSRTEAVVQATRRGIILL